MPIVFISLHQHFIETIKTLGFEGYCMKIQDYVPRRKTYYISAANSLCFMDGGIDLALSREVFPGIELEVKAKVRDIGKLTLLGRPYLPIGSSMILDMQEHSLVVAPTMLLPQDVSKTQNAYYATMAILYNILENRNESLENVDILMTSMCCGYGKMAVDDSIQQILKAIHDYKSYSPKKYDEDTVLKEPNLHQQPKYYQNTEWFTISPDQIQRV